MKRFLKAATCMGLFFIAVVAAAGGQERIITQLPSLTEIVFELGLGDRVVGVSDFDRHPPQVKDIPRIGGAFNLNFERILSLRPTLVLLDRAMKDTTAQYRKLGIRTLVTKNTSVADVYRTIQSVGQATGRKRQAAALIGRLRNELKAVEDQYRGRGPVRTLVVIGHDPGALRSVFVAAKGSFHDELLSIAGGVNCIEKSVSPYPTVSKEILIQKDPQCILVLAPGADGSPDALDRERALWSDLKVVDAVKNGRIHLLTDDRVQQCGPHMPEIARSFAERIHGKGD